MAIKSWKSQTISNSFMFRLVMERPEICKQLLERILEIKINHIVYLDAEKSFEARLDSKGIRLDIYVEDEDKTIYNVEMQANDKDKEHLGKRTRYYQSLTDQYALKKGALYRDLRQTFIIFICTFDPFGRNYSKYTFSNLCNEDTTVRLNDNTQKIFLNTAGDRHRVSKDLANFLDYVNDGKAKDEFTLAINSMVNELRNDTESEARYMTYEQTIMEAERNGEEKGIAKGLAEGLVQGKAEGLVQGKAEGKVEALKQLMKNMNISVKEAMKLLGIPMSDLAKYSSLL